MMVLVKGELFKNPVIAIKKIKRYVKVAKIFVKILEMHMINHKQKNYVKTQKDIAEMYKILGLRYILKAQATKKFLKAYIK